MSARQTCAHASPCLCEVEALRAKLAAADKRAADANSIANVADRALRDADKRTEAAESSRDELAAQVQAQALQIAKAEKRIETAEFIQKQADLLLRQKEKAWKARVEITEKQVEALALQNVKLREAIKKLLCLDDDEKADAVCEEAATALALDTKDAEKTVADMKANFWPKELTKELREVLGIMVFRTGPLAGLYRETKTADIPRKVEEEQAFILHKLVGYVLLYGSKWRKEFDKEVQPLFDKAEAARARSEGERESDLKRENNDGN